MNLSWKTSKRLRGLVFDIENKPGTYGPGEYTHPKVTAVGCQFLDATRARGWCFKRDDPAGLALGVEEFRRYWDAADFVVGHNIRRHDIRILNGFLTAQELPLLAEKRAVDTYLDLPKMQGLSRSLENLAARWGCPIKKMNMPEHVWEGAYDGVPEFVELMHKRVVSDVKINVWLYFEELRRGLL